MSATNPTRATTRISQAPGGNSSIIFGNEMPPPSPKAAIAPAATETHAAEPVAEPAPAAPEEPVDERPSLESLKLAAISAVAGATDTPSVRDALTTLVKSLQTASSAAVIASRETPAAAAASGSAGAAAGAEESPYAASLAALKAALKLRGTHGIISIGKKFRSMDDSGDRKLTYDEFKKALIEMKLGLNEADMSRLFRHFDRDASGFVTFDELLLGLRGELNDRRLDMVKRCYKVLDKSGDGVVTLAELEHRYDASHHPDVIAGIKTPRQVLLEFLSVFEEQGGGVKGDGQVDFEEFKAYYSMISANIDEGEHGDDYFELMMRNVWHVSGGEGWCANTTCKRVLVVFEDDSQKVVELTDDFDVDTKDLAAVKAKLAEQGVTGIKSVALYGDMSSTESGSGPSMSAPPRTPGAPPRSPAGAAAAGAPTASPEPSIRPGTGRRGANPDHNRSSIIFG
ncbi:hypothetical protein HYH02_012678 [Chlamydomonas schloesseri]|uniref:EF-hand domain-containing protein n=1 Tax=Chlamydomonas schloesseri TaxID=2026947 RepID=A0A835SXH6_9CHLO|nr:hypothetical protein HYH02_012678 [Chlamydomonas schloesseri]|eukprot:KAG2433561.1 hypothetical protein HYH02_012678 [Chlamydomonas schloesseri]